MKPIELAALPAKTPLLAALVVMREKNQSGVIRVDGSELQLVTAPEVVVGLHNDKDTLQDLGNLANVSTDFLALCPRAPLPGLKVRKWLECVPGGKLHERGAKVLGVPADKLSLDQYFSEASSDDYVLVDLTIGLATIITSSETLEEFLNQSPSRPYCSCDTSFHNIPLTIGGTCPLHACPVTELLR